MDFLDASLFDTTTTTPGVYRGVPNHLYHAHEAINASGLKLIGRSPAHYRHARLNPATSTPAMVLGTAVHTRVLEPELWNTSVTISSGSTRTKAYRELVAGAGPGDLILSQDQADAATSIASAVEQHPAAAMLARSSAAGMNELTVLARIQVVDVETGQEFDILARARPDALVPVGDGGYDLVDLKTTKDASESAFARDFHNYGYHLSLAFYAKVLERAGLPIRRTLVIAAEKEAPYNVVVYEPKDHALAKGDAEAERLAARYASCAESGIWPGYPTEPQPLDLPRWAY